MCSFYVAGYKIFIAKTNTFLSYDDFFFKMLFWINQNLISMIPSLWGISVNIPLLLVPNAIVAADSRGQ